MAEKIKLENLWTSKHKNKLSIPTTYYAIRPYEINIKNYWSQLRIITRHNSFNLIIDKYV